MSEWLGRKMVTTKSQQKATRAHRRRAAAQGLVRLEVQAAKNDTGLIREVAKALRGRPEQAEALRSALTNALHPEVKTAFDVFGSDLPEDVFSGVFDHHPRHHNWREVDL